VASAARHTVVTPWSPVVRAAELLLWGDIVHNARCNSRARPAISFDTDQRWRSRTASGCSTAATDKLLIAGSHLPFRPRPRRQGFNDYAYVPVEWGADLRAIIRDVRRAKIARLPAASSQERRLRRAASAHFICHRTELYRARSGRTRIKAFDRQPWNMRHLPGGSFAPPSSHQFMTAM